MKNQIKHPLIALALLALSTLNSQLATAHAQGTAFTYQGRLNNGTNPATGSFDLTFSLFGVSSGGSSLAGPVTNTAVGVTNGLFTVMVDFGAGVFTGSSNWLSIGVRTNGGGAFTALTPRQQVTPTPYAIFAESANAAGLTGAVPAGDLTGVSGSGLISLNASQLTSGTVPDARLAADVALTDANQTFTGTNTFSTGTGSGRLTVLGFGGIDTSMFTGLGLQYYASSGEGAILSSYNDGYGFLSFYTKQGSGSPIAKQVIIDKYGGVAIDQQNFNTGILNHTSTNGVGLTFGVGSGEGIASQRTAGINQYGLDFYTGFARRMSILQNGNIGIGTTNPAANLDLYSASQAWLREWSASTANGSVLELRNDTASALNLGAINFSSALATPGQIAYQPANGMIFRSGGSPQVTIATSGNVTFNSAINLQSSNSGLKWTNSVAGVTVGPGGSGPFLWGFDGGALGTVSPDEVNLTWDYSGNVWVNNNLSAASMTVRGNYLVVNGGSPVYAYFGDDGYGNDVQIGSQMSGVTALAAYNTADNAYMHFYCSSITIEGGADLAEPFSITSGQGEIPQGAVVVIDEQNPGHLKLSDQSYDQRVAGVVSGANGINPGIQMQQQGLLEGGKNVALTGRVYVQTDASNGAIKPGDLLTTSATPGYAMKVTDHARASGAILGKAMTGLSEGRGLVLVLVTLQ